MIWLSIKRTAELLEITPRRVFQLIRHEEIKARVVGKSANGKPRREVKLESLEPEVQDRYFRSLGSHPSMPIAAQAAVEEKTENRDEEKLHPADGAVAAAPSAVFPLIGLSEEKLEETTRIAEALHELLQSKGGRSAREATARKLAISMRTLKRYLRDFRRDGAKSLLRKKRRDAGVSRVADGHIISKINKVYLNPHRPGVAQIHREIVKDYELSGKPPPSYWFVRSVVKGIDPDLVAKHRIGEKEYDDKYAYTSLRKKPQFPREWVDFDHHQVDHYVIFDDGSIGRPWITPAHDICTGEILGYVMTKEKRATYPGANAIALAIRCAILRSSDPAWPSYGLFKNLYADLGRDFRSNHIRLICADLGIAIVHTRGYHGKSKPIERWFRTYEEGLRGLPGYCGKDHATNPERQRLGAPRSFEDMRGELMTVAQFDEATRKWIVEDYHHAASRSLGGLSPIEALAAHVKNGLIAREIRDERVLDLLLMQHRDKPSLVGKNGIQLFHRFFWSNELGALTGQYVEPRWDPANVGELVVYKDGKFICKAANRELIDYGASEETLRREREIKREQKRSNVERYERLVAKAQHPNPLAQAIAEKRQKEVLSEERGKMIANGTPGRRVYKLLPKYQKAKLEINARKPDSPARSKSRPDRRMVDDEPLLSSEELFKREANPFLEMDDFPEVCHDCGRKEKSLLYCLECAPFPDSEPRICDKCGGCGQHRRCDDCRHAHDLQNHPRVEE